MGRLPKAHSYAAFENNPNCWSKEVLPDSLDDVFTRQNKLMIELGSGTCYFSTGFAEEHEDFNVIATDFKRDRLWKGAKRADKLKLTNVAFINIDVAKLVELIPEHSVDQLWLTFPDPHPKKSHKKRRMNQLGFLETDKKLLKPSGSFHLKTDDRDFFVETIVLLEKANWQFDQISADSHRDCENGDQLIKTRYENEFIEAGIPINYLQASI